MPLSSKQSQRIFLLVNLRFVLDYLTNEVKHWLVFILKILGFSSCNIQLFLESTEQHLIIFSRTLLFSTALTYNSKNSRLCRSIYIARDSFIFTVKKIFIYVATTLPGHCHVKVHKLTRILKNYICNLIYTKKNH